MAGSDNVLCRGARTVALFGDLVSGSKLKEYSILVYVGIFLAMNAANVTLLSSTGWTVYEPYNPSPANESVLTDNSPTVSAAYWDEDGDPGTLTFYDASGSEISSCSVSNGSRCGVEWSGASAHDNYWYAVAEDDEGDTAQGPWWYFLINNPPNSVSSPDNPSDGATIYSDTVDLKVTVSDPDGDEMNVEFLNNVSNMSESERTVHDVGDGEQATVSQDLTRGYTYKWWVRVHDNWHSTKSDSWSFYVNSLPKLESVQPLDGSIHTETEAILNATATDKEQDSLTVYFFDDQNNFLGKDSGPDGEKLSSDRWEGLRVGNTYEWKVNVSDGHGNSTHQFSFITSASEEYRVDHSINVDYSSIITSTESTRAFMVSIENQVSTDKQMVTYLTGVNAYFNENGENSMSYTLPGYGTEEFLVTVAPEDPDEDAELKVVSENTRIRVNTTESIPVTVREVPQVADTRSVPGITGLQLFAVMLASLLLYYRRL